MEQKPPESFDWGDGTIVTVKKPDLSHLEKVTCPTDCFPEGEEGTGQVISTSTPDEKSSTSSL